MKLTAEKRESLLRAHHQEMLWTRFAMIFLGFWLLTTPATFGYVETALRWSDWISGILLILLGTLSLSYRFSGSIYGAIFIGIWLQFAPLVFWATKSAFYLNDTFIGIVVLALCLFVPQRPKELDRGPQIPPGWSYNPSSWQQRMIIVILVIIAWFLARYMASFQLHYITKVFDPLFGMGTEKVITSLISQKFPVADAGLGALAYSLEAIMAVKGGVRRWHTMPWIVLSFGILVLPVGFVSIVLIMLQPIAVGAWCGICLFIASCMLLILAFSVDEVIATLQYLKRASKGKERSFWSLFFKGSAYNEGEEGDERTPKFSESFKKNSKAMFWGISVPFSLFVSALLGLWILFLDLFFPLPKFMEQSFDVIGALIVVFSVISWAEVLRSLRFINIGLALLLSVTPFVVPGGLSFIIVAPTLFIAFLLILCSLPRGKIKEKYGNWNKMII